ncbi:hypothetical protein AcetOrient_orf04061 [Acetobacter orientalis]|uniref:Uncharacterized protein n=1 Tax=Acetobacter orientalis TaxID=146474 RepID=A0A2Z5ZL08_9PROT|nr:hypothetical protein AcetOrient_orf04061 [Acetobacter orientalis]
MASVSYSGRIRLKKQITRHSLIPACRALAFTHHRPLSLR